MGLSVGSLVVGDGVGPVGVEVDTYGEVVGDTVGEQVYLRQQLVLHTMATLGSLSQSFRRLAHSDSAIVLGKIGSPVRGPF